MAIRRRMYRSRSGRPRSGRLISSRGGGCFTVGLPGGLSASHESHRRHRYQRSPPESRANRLSSGRSAAASVPSSSWPCSPQPISSYRSLGRYRRGRSVPGAPSGTAGLSLLTARDYPATAAGNCQPAQAADISRQAGIPIARQSAAIKPGTPGSGRRPVWSRLCAGARSRAGAGPRRRSRATTRRSAAASAVRAATASAAAIPARFERHPAWKMTATGSSRSGPLP